MILITGDMHGDINRFNKKKYRKLKLLNEDDYLIVVGDFGFLFLEDGGQKEKNELEQIGNQKYTTLFIDGNHDNHNKINSYEEMNMLGGKVNKINDKLFHLKRGEVYTIEDKTFFCFGGALSIDKFLREENVNWWSTEYPSDKEIENAYCNLKKYNNKVDIVLTHTVQNSILEKMFLRKFISQYIRGEKINDEVTSVLECMLKNVEYTHQFFGHFHVDENIDFKHTCLYYNMIDLL